MFDFSEKTTNAINFALDYITKQYGTGNYDGQTPLKYHNYHHTIATLNDAVTICRMMDKDNNYIELVAIACAFHDFVQQQPGEGTNEQLSANAAEKYLVNFSPEEVAQIVAAILGTTTYFVDGVMLQKVNNTDLMSMIIADADLSSLGSASDKYWASALKLEEEFNGPNSEITKKIAFHKGSAQLLRHHRYFTAEAASLFPNQSRNLTEIEGFVKQLEKAAS